jgi:hypothetical protein
LSFLGGERSGLKATTYIGAAKKRKRVWEELQASAMPRKERECGRGVASLSSVTQLGTLGLVES